MCGARTDHLFLRLRSEDELVVALRRAINVDTEAERADVFLSWYLDRPRLLRQAALEVGQRDCALGAALGLIILEVEEHGRVHAALAEVARPHHEVALLEGLPPVALLVHPAFMDWVRKLANSCGRQAQCQHCIIII